MAFLNPSPAIMSLDLATNTGFAYGRPGEKPRIGSIRLGSGTHGSVGAGLDDWLWDFNGISTVESLVVEAHIPQHKGQAAAQIAIGLLMVCEMFAYRADIPLKVCAPTSVRARVVGNGRAQKPEVVAWCKAQGWDAPDHDAADAAALWVLACRVATGKDTYGK